MTQRLVLSLVLLAVAPDPAWAQASLKGGPPWSLVVVSTGKEWPMAARILLEGHALLPALGARNFAVETAVPDEPNDELKALLKRIRKGRRLIGKMKLDQAVQALDDVTTDLRTLIEKHGGTPGLLRRFYQAYSYLGTAHQANADAASSAKAFRVCLSLDPKKRLSAKYFAEEVIQAYDELRKSTPATATLKVSADEPALVLVDGRLRGITPVVASDLIAGEHLVEVRRLGYRPTIKFVSVDAKLGARLDLTLAKTSDHDAVIERLKRVAAELRRASAPGKEVPALATALKASRLLLFRASLEDGEASLFDAPSANWVKRVRRISALPGQPPGKLIAEALKQQSPILDLQAGSAASGGACEENEDCPGGRCVAGRCVSETPIYKKWWFWVAIGLAAGAVAGGGAALGLMPQRPVIQIRIAP
jgi:hypothetical protein